MQGQIQARIRDLDKEDKMNPELLSSVEKGCSLLPAGYLQRVVSQFLQKHPMDKTLPGILQTFVCDGINSHLKQNLCDLAKLNDADFRDCAALCEEEAPTSCLIDRMVWLMNRDYWHTDRGRKADLPFRMASWLNLYRFNRTFQEALAAGHTTEDLWKQLAARGWPLAPFRPLWRASKPVGALFQALGAGTVVICGATKTNFIPGITCLVDYENLATAISDHCQQQPFQQLSSWLEAAVVIPMRRGQRPALPRYEDIPENVEEMDIAEFLCRMLPPQRPSQQA